MRHVLSLFGTSDTNLMPIRYFNEHGPAYQLEGSVDICATLTHPDLQFSELTLGGTEPQPLPPLATPDVIFNCITDADSNAQALQLAAAAIAQLQPRRVLNHPDRVLQNRRDDVAGKLAGIPGVLAPATIRIRPQTRSDILQALCTGPVGYPAIIRRAGTHGGNSMLLLRNTEEAMVRLERIACDGSDYYLIRFVDYRDGDGLYRKLRLVLVDGVAYPRHYLASKYWNVHASARTGQMAKGLQLLADEDRLLNAFEHALLPRLAARLAAIHQRLGLDYFVIDCALLPDDQLLVFEANASGNALGQKNIHKYPHLRKPIQRLRKAAVRMLLADPAPH